MKRRPQFRIWDKKENKYFKPVFRVYAGELLDMSISMVGQLMERTLKDGSRHESCFPGRYIVEWCWGSRDKNHVKVFEGDIVKMRIQSPHFNGYCMGEVKLIPSRGLCMINPVFKDDNGECYSWNRQYKKIASYISEVVGNVH